MRGSRHRAARAAAMMLGAVLIAAPEIVASDDMALPPMPAPAGGVAGAGVADAPDAGTAGPAGATAQGAGRDAQPAAAAIRADAAQFGSRLLRALAEGAGAAEVPPGDTTPVFAAEGCPRALLRRLLAGAVDEADVLSALAIEREVLGLCRERQEIVAGLFETEALLRELRASAAPPAVVAQSAVPEAPESAPPAPSLLLSTLATKETATDPEPEGPQVSRYAWFSIIGSAGALRAGITDGADMWFVRAGDRLPDGGTVAAIAGRPPAVRVTGPQREDGEIPLPWRSRPGGGP